MTRSSPAGPHLEVPEALAASHAMHFGYAGRAWIDALPQLAADCLDRWALRRNGPPSWGAVALVLPVLLADDTPAVLKLQPVDDETAGEPVALRVRDGNGAVRLLRHDPDTGSMVLKRLDAGRTLATVPDHLAALRTISELLARLNAVPAPPGIRRLADLAAAMLDRLPYALPRLSDPAEHRPFRSCAGAVQDLLPEAGDRLLHWDLHYDNVLQPLDLREPWLAGDPSFELLAALHNRWEEVVATGNLSRAVQVRFDLMTEVLGLGSAARASRGNSPPHFRARPAGARHRSAASSTGPAWTPSTASV